MALWPANIWRANWHDIAIELHMQSKWTTQCFFQYHNLYLSIQRNDCTESMILSWICFIHYYSFIHLFHVSKCVTPLLYSDWRNETSKHAEQYHNSDYVIHATSVSWYCDVFHWCCTNEPFAPWIFQFVETPPQKNIFSLSQQKKTKHVILSLQKILYNM